MKGLLAKTEEGLRLGKGGVKLKMLTRVAHCCCSFSAEVRWHNNAKIEWHVLHLLIVYCWLNINLEGY